MHFEILGSKGPSSNPNAPTGPPASLWFCSYRFSVSGGVCLAIAHRRWLGAQVSFSCGYIQVGDCEYK